MGVTRSRGQVLTLAAACLAQGMMVLDVMIVNVALPSLQGQLHLSPSDLEWVVSGYALALAALIPVGGTLGDHFGRKRIFLMGVVLFTATSALCALSVSGEMLIGFRILQGVGGAIMSSLTLSLITEAYPVESRSGPIGLWAAVSGLAVAAGTVIGGLLLSVFPWSSIFWVNIPLGFACIALALIGVTESRQLVPQSFDLVGVGLSTGGLLLVTIGFVRSSDATWHAPVVDASVATGLVVLVGFWIWEHHARTPMVPLALWRTPTFSWSSIVYLLAYLAFAGFIYYVTLFFQNVQGWTALHTGLSWLTFCVPYAVVTQMSTRVARHFAAPTAVALGCVVAAAGVAGMSQLSVTTPFVWVALWYVLVGIGFGLFVPACSLAAMSRLPEDSSGIGSGVFNASRQLGTALGLGILASVASTVARQSWHERVTSLPPNQRHKADALSLQVAGGQVHHVASTLGHGALDPAVSSFTRGLEVALLTGALVLVVSAVIGYVGLRRPANLPSGRSVLLSPDDTALARPIRPA
jgi:MFS transporter, DHA2 family, methylenomycin A resistance protein